MESIVVGLDGTEASLVALDWAAERAARGPCRMQIVRVDRSGWLGGEHAEDPALVSAQRRAGDRAPSAEIASRAVAGRMPDTLVREAQGADLLVIGAHRRRPVRSALTGWLPLRTVSRSRIPVAVVPDGWSGLDGPIVVGVDDDDSSSEAIRFAAAEAEAAGVGLTMVHAWMMPPPTTDGAVALLASPIEVKGGHRRILDQAHRDVVQTHPALAVERSLVHDNPIDALLTAASTASLLVLGTHHRGFLAAAMLGSVGQDALWQCDIPVCVVPRVVSVL